MVKNPELLLNFRSLSGYSTNITSFRQKATNVLEEPQLPPSGYKASKIEIPDL
jgi:hypothetical protein